MKKAKPTKLRSGEWGVSVAGRPAPGECVIVRSRAGKEWDAEIVRVVWTDPAGRVSICQTRSRRQREQRSSRRTGCSCGSREDRGVLVPSVRNCWQCEHDA